jgi:hypothetical protein
VTKNNTEPSAADGDPDVDHKMKTLRPVYDAGHIEDF